MCYVLTRQLHGLVTLSAVCESVNICHCTHLERWWHQLQLASSYFSVPKHTGWRLSLAAGVPTYLPITTLDTHNMLVTESSWWELNFQNTSCICKSIHSKRKFIWTFVMQVSTYTCKSRWLILQSRLLQQQHTSMECPVKRLSYIL